MAIFPCKPGSAGSPLGSSSTCSGNQGMVERKRSKSEWEWKTTEKPQFWPNFVTWGSCIHPHCRSGPNFMCERVPRVYSSPPNFTLIVVYCYPRQAKNCCIPQYLTKLSTFCTHSHSLIGAKFDVPECTNLAKFHTDHHMLLPCKMKNCHIWQVIRGCQV